MRSTTPTPAAIDAERLAALLADVGASDALSTYTVCSIGIYHQPTGYLIECDTTPVYAAVGASPGEKITFSRTQVSITRYAVMRTP